METVNRFWFEIEYPTKDMGKVVKGRSPEDVDRIGEERAAKACVVLKAIGIDFGPRVNAVWWNKRLKTYCFSTSEAGTFYEASDCGHWFNLDWLADKNTPKPSPLETDENIGSVEPS